MDYQERDDQHDALIEMRNQYATVMDELAETFLKYWRYVADRIHEFVQALGAQTEKARGKPEPFWTQRPWHEAYTRSSRSNSVVLVPGRTNARGREHQFRRRRSELRAVRCRGPDVGSCVKCW